MVECAKCKKEMNEKSTWVQLDAIIHGSKRVHVNLCLKCYKSYNWIDTFRKKKSKMLIVKIIYKWLKIWHFYQVLYIKKIGKR